MKYLLILFTVVSFGQFNPIFTNSSGKSQLNPGNTNLSAYYKLDNSTVDATTLSPTGTPTGIDYVTGKTGQAARFDSSTDAIIMADDDNFSFTTGVSDTDFSVSFWVYFTGFSSNNNRLIAKRSDDGVSVVIPEWQITASASTLQVVKFSGAGTTNFRVYTQNREFSLNRWYHITVTSSVSDVIIYVNSIRNVTSVSTTGTYVAMANTTAHLEVGNLLNNTNTRHQGYLEDIGIWKNRVLTPSEVNYLYNNGNGRTYPF